jgi:putative transposase
VEAGLVRHAHEWPGAKTTVDDIGIGTIQANRPDVYFSPKNPEWVLEADLTVSLPPSIPVADAQSFRDNVAIELAKLEAAAHKVIPARAVVGPKRVAKVPPETRITTVKPIRQHNPTFAVGRGNADAGRNAARAVRSFRAAYRKALEAWRAGDRTVAFPAGTYGMRVFHGANVGPTIRSQPIA